MKRFKIRVRLLSICLLLGVALSSCSNISQVEVGEVNDFSIKGFEGNALLIEVKVPVKNPSRHKINVTGLDTKVYFNNSYLGRINSIDPILIPRKSFDNYNIILSVRLSNPLGTAFTIMNLQQGQKINIKIEGEIFTRSSGIKKRISIKEELNVVL